MKFTRLRMQATRKKQLPTIGAFDRAQVLGPIEISARPKLGKNILCPQADIGSKAKYVIILA